MGFNFVSKGIWFALIAAFLWTMKDQDERIIENEIGASMESSCISVRTRKPYDNPNATPTAEQTAMATLVARMDESAIGRELNAAGDKNNLIWCAGVSADYYGAYTMGVGILSLPAFGGAQSIIDDRRTQNRALRTMYEENAHAWQSMTQHAGSASWDSLPHHKIAWIIAVESTARVTAFTALNQHSLAGDRAVWQDNITEDKNRLIMTRMQNAADPATGVFGTESFWAGFDAFYDRNALVWHYQTSASEGFFARLGAKPVANADISILGAVPGIEGNYMLQRFDIDNPRYSGILNPALREELLRDYNKKNRDTRPLTRGLLAWPRSTPSLAFE